MFSQGLLYRTSEPEGLRSSGELLSSFKWNDTACIIQDDTLVKAKQILLMSQVYRWASKVVVYLGYDTECQLAIGLLKELRLFIECGI
jgi:hypothetical protein